jgi:IS1 family transposase
VVRVEFRAVFGSEVSVRAALMTSPVSRAISTAFVERQNGTDRHRNARKGHKTYRFSKEWQFHEAATYLTLASASSTWY